MISLRKTHFFLRLSISIAVIGILFKIMHWPYDWVLLVLGIIGISVFYTIRFYKKKVRGLFDYLKLSLLISFLLHYAFRVFHLNYGFVFTAIFQIFLVIFVVSYIYDTLFSKKDREKNEALKIGRSKKSVLSYLLYSFAGIGIVIGALFKILHWQFGPLNGDFLLIIGLFSAAISVFIDYNSNQKVS